MFIIGNLLLYVQKYFLKEQVYKQQMMTKENMDNLLKDWFRLDNVEDSGRGIKE